jgi:hypothetical protein
LFDSKPTEIAQLNNPALSRIDSFQRTQRLVEPEKVFGLAGGDRGSIIQRNLDCASTPFVACVCARVIDEEVTHHLRADREKVCAILPFKSVLLTGEF